MTPTDPNERMQEIRQSVADYRSGLDQNGDALLDELGLGDIVRVTNGISNNEEGIAQVIAGPHNGDGYTVKLRGDRGFNGVEVVRLREELILVATAMTQEGGDPEDELDAGSTDTLPSDSQARKGIPLVTGLLDYFPAALAEVAKVSKFGNDKHNPGLPLHHARGKSMDHADALARHLVDRGKIDKDTGQRHSAEVAWRALALLQEELEAEGLAPLPRGARLS